LLTPLTRRYRQRPLDYFAIDNGAYSNFKEKEFRALLSREYYARHLCRFVCCPDIVGAAMRTIELFNHYKHELKDWPLALVAQDGLENIQIPWNEIKAIFIGGSTQWKTSKYAEDICRTGRILGKWIHIGRVNTRQRFEWAAKFADSCDGTGISRYTEMRLNIGRENKQIPIFN